MAGIAACWGFIGVLVRWVDLPAVAIVFSRCALAAVTLGVFLGLRHLRSAPRAAATVSPVPVRRRKAPRWGLLLLGVALAVHWLLLAAAQQRAPLGTVLLITYLAPVIVTCLAPHLLRERVPGRTYLAAGLGLAGIAVLVRPGTGFGAGEALALGAAGT